MSAAKDLSPGERPSALNIDLQRDPAGANLVLAGDLDLSSAGQLEDALSSLLATAPQRLTIDLRPLVFLDSCGLRAILTAHRDCEQAGCALTLIAGEQASRLFELTGVSESLPLAHAPESRSTDPA